MVIGGGVTDIQRAQYARNAGFPENEIARAVAISIAENLAGDPSAEHHNSDGSIDRGLWQINSVHNFPVSQLNDPQGNARAAFQVWSEAGRSWRPWSTFKDAKYMAYYQRGQFAAKNRQAPDPNAGPQILIPGDSSLQSVVDFFKFISNAHNWQRIGMFILGGILIIIGLFKLSGDNRMNQGTKALIKTAVTAVPK